MGALKGTNSIAANVVQLKLPVTSCISREAGGTDPERAGDLVDLKANWKRS